MTCLFNSTDLAKDHLKAAIHPIDFTMRPQLVDEQNNKEYYDLMKQYFDHDLIPNPYGAHLCEFLHALELLPAL